MNPGIMSMHLYVALHICMAEYVQVSCMNSLCINWVPASTRQVRAAQHTAPRPAQQRPMIWGTLAPAAAGQRCDARARAGGRSARRAVAADAASWRYTCMKSCTPRPCHVTAGGAALGPYAVLRPARPPGGPHTTTRTDRTTHRHGGDRPASD